MRRKLTDRPPRISVNHLSLPDQVARLLRAKPVHSLGLTGKGIKVGVIDSGFYPHPFYVSRGYRIRYVPTESEPNPHIDIYGHGTAHLSSLFAIAPDAEVLAIKCNDQGPMDALKKAIELQPDVLTCAWGFDGTSQPVDSIVPLLTQLTREGTVVILSSESVHDPLYTSLSDVIITGGVHYQRDGTFAPSNFYSSKQAPDVYGLVGKPSAGQLVLAPVPPRSLLTKASESGASSFASEGWALFSGMSAAASMISGAAALVLQASPGLEPATVKKILVESSRPIEGAPPERLIDVRAAVEAARKAQTKYS